MYWGSITSEDQYYWNWTDISFKVAKSRKSEEQFSTSSPGNFKFCSGSFQRLQDWIKLWIYLESSELSCLKGDWTAHILSIAQEAVSSQAKAGEFAPAELNSSEPPYFFSPSTQAGHRSTGSWNQQGFLLQAEELCYSEDLFHFTNTCSVEESHLSRDMVTRGIFSPNKAIKKFQTMD